jgi:alkanesulfonate monooxygenase SsuD/methylene tetrahydromethanopterin reductase-like flavin-dependent oxidoreductase (luciferase family)
LRVGFSVLLLSLHHPVRLAEEIATLDVLSGGRVNLGISRGANPRYLAAYGIESETTDARFHSAIAQILHCWQAAPIDFGQHSLSVEPKPVQQPHPPIFVGTYTDATVEWTARNGFHLICHGITNLDHMRGLLDVFANAGGDIGTVPFGRFVYVSESDASAKSELWPTIINLTSRLSSIGIARRSRFLNEADLEPEKFYRDMVIVGSPETCARRIAGLRREFGFNYLNALSAFFGFLPLDLLERSLRLLATEVRPRVAQMDLAQGGPSQFFRA